MTRQSHALTFIRGKETGVYDGKYIYQEPGIWDTETEAAKFRKIIETYMLEIEKIDSFGTGAAVYFTDNSGGFSNEILMIGKDDGIATNYTYNPGGDESDGWEQWDYFHPLTDVDGKSEFHMHLYENTDDLHDPAASLRKFKEYVIGVAKADLKILEEWLERKNREHEARKEENRQSEEKSRNLTEKWKGTTI